MNKALTSQELGEIRVRDSAVQINTDHYGGKWVAHKEGRIHGQHAIMDRRQLLAHLDTLAAVDVVAKDIVAMPTTITAGLSDRLRAAWDEGSASGPLTAVQMCECGWVMEAPPLPGHTLGQAAVTQYMCFKNGTPDLQWTDDPRQALRFAREDDVRAFMGLTPLARLLTRPKFFEWVTPC